MCSRGGEKRCAGATGKPKEQEKEDEEDFYDCQETLEPSDPRRQEEKVEVKDETHIKTDRLTDRRHDTDREMGGGEQGEERGERKQQQEEVQDDGPQEEVQQDDGLQEEVQDEDEVQDDGPQEEVQDEDEVQDDGLQEDSDSEMKEEVDQEVEFDDDYLKETEKDLTEEEKESRRQQSLTLKEKGNGQFKAGDWSEAEQSYTEALSVCPVCFSKERAVLFSNRAAARLHLDRKDKAISDCGRAIELNPEYLRALLRRAELYEQTDKLDEALEDYKSVLDRDPSHAGARQACMRLPPQIQERNEKLKEEMLSKLKDLGNMVLRPFGLSTNNFQVNQDAGSGSYSINFVQGPNNNNR